MAFVFIGLSESFQDCEHKHKDHKSYRALHEESSIGIKAVVRLELHVACTFEAAHENEGALTLLATVLIAGFTGTLWFETNRLYRAGEKQLHIAEASRKLTEAALDRPYVLVESMAIRFVEGSEHFVTYFDFHLRNYGKGPAIIKHIVAHGFLNGGVRWEPHRNDYAHDFFPEPDRIDDLLGDRQSVRVFPEVGPDELSFNPRVVGYRINQSTIVLSPGKKSPTFTHFAKDIWLRKGKPAHIAYGQTPPWLLGRVTYLDVFDRPHQTQFCFRVRSDGIAEEYGDAPYNKRT